MRKLTILIALLLAATVAVGATLSDPETKRIQEAAAVLREIHAMPEKDVPPALWDKAQCVIVVPSLYGRGRAVRERLRPSTRPQLAASAPGGSGRLPAE